MSIYECNENQFVENVRRLIESRHNFVVNRRVTLSDDYRYGLATIPNEEFKKYEMICERRGYKHTVYAKVPFFDDFHRRLYSQNEALHSSSNLAFPRISLPYYRVEYSFSIWGSTYIHSFDVLFKPEIVMEKRRIKSSVLIHVLKFNPPDEDMIKMNLPDKVMVLDVKKMARIFDL